MTNRQLLKERVATLTDAEVTEVLEYITIMESLRGQAQRRDLFADMNVEAWVLMLQSQATMEIELTGG